MCSYQVGLVSVIMPTYRRSEKLTRAIESVLGQSYKNIELLLVNDNEPEDQYSKDLQQQVSAYKSDSRFKLIMQQKHVNGAVARNVGIRQAKGEYIAFLDDDDWWKPEKIERQVEMLSSLPEEWGGVSCKIEKYNNDQLFARTRAYEGGHIYKDILMLKTDVATGTILLRHKALDQAGYFDENLRRHQDLQLLVQFTYRFKLLQVNEYLHCCDVSDAQNRPDGEKLLQHKERFFLSVRAVINTLTTAEKRCIDCIHKFEVGYTFFKSRRFGNAMRYCLAVLKSPRAAVLAVKKVAEAVWIRKI